MVHSSSWVLAVPLNICWVTIQVKMEATLKPEALDAVERKIGQLEMEARSLKPKVLAFSLVPAWMHKHPHLIFSSPSVLSPHPPSLGTLRTRGRAMPGGD